MPTSRNNRGTKVTQSPSDARHHPNTYRGQPDLPHAHPMPGRAICSTCHAIWDDKHWTLDEPRYQAMAIDPATTVLQCPGCVKVERQEYDGEVTLKSPLIPENIDSVLGLITNTERRVREHNPIARIASLTVEDDSIRVLTISTFLAERIGKELEKAYDGQLSVKHAEREEFIRVTWFRE